MSELQHKSPEQAQPSEISASEFTPPEFIGHSELNEARQQAELDHAERTEGKESAVADALGDVHELFKSDGREPQPAEAVDDSEKQETKSIYDIGAPVLMVELEHLSHARNMGPRSAQKDPATVETGWRISATDDKDGTFTLEKPTYSTDAHGNKVPGLPRIMKGVSTVDLIAWNHNAKDLERVQQEKLEKQEEQKRKWHAEDAAASTIPSEEISVSVELGPHIVTDATGRQRILENHMDSPSTPGESPVTHDNATFVTDFGAPSREPGHAGNYMPGYNLSEVSGGTRTPNSEVGIDMTYAKHEGVSTSQDRDGYGIRNWWRKRKATRKRRKELKKQGSGNNN